MDFSFIIINYRTLDLSRNCLDSLFNYLPNDKSWEIILIDNCSNDDSAPRLKQKFQERLTFIQNDTNRGFAGANNQGAQIAKGKYLFFLNSDTEIKENILPPLKQLLESKTEIGVLAPKVLNPEGKWQFGACGRQQTLKNLFLQNTKANWLRSKKADYWETDWVSGAALIIRRDVFMSIKGWDEKFFLYLEDTDLCLRTRKSGYLVVICPSASLIHYGGKSPARQRSRRRYYYFSQNYFFKKHYGLLASLIMRFIRLPYKTIKLLKK
ncbi:MAG: glycosyltransferase family 2 protein [Patescibacteria group bacterium]